MRSTCTEDPSGGHQPNMMMKPASLPTLASHLNSALPKSDSGINSGSDLQSSPETVHSENWHQSSLSSNFLMSSKVNMEPIGSVTDSNFGNNLKHEEERLQLPKVNPRIKAKTFKCKQCEFVAYIKEDLWIHTREHIPPGKRLPCPKCPFVTGHKHHLVYHIRNHAGSKPFKCPKCDYSCVNKAMLNSHLKSHTDIHQYNCLDCDYHSKHCHSLKLHLRKHNHRPGHILNADGTPNLLPNIDVYGTRRGPKLNVQERNPVEESSANSHLLPLQQLILNTLYMQLPISGYPFSGVPIFPRSTGKDGHVESTFTERSVENYQAEVLDLSKSKTSRPKNRRKGCPRKVDLVPFEEISSDEEMATIFPLEEIENVDLKSQTEVLDLSKPKRRKDRIVEMEEILWDEEMLSDEEMITIFPCAEVMLNE